METTKTLRNSNLAISSALLTLLITGCHKLLPESNAKSSDALKHHFEFKVLSVQVAEPGRVIHASVGGTNQSTYTCTEDDAAVAVVYITDSNKTSLIGYSAGSGVDEVGHRYATSFKANGNWCFITVLKGFPKAPAKVTVPLRVFPVRPISTAKRTEQPIVFTEFSNPTRVISPPTSAKLAEVNRIATATAYGDGSDISLQFKNGMSADFDLQGFSYSPHGTGFEYGAVSDAVKVVIRPFTTRQTRSVLTYHNAKLIDAHGFRLLTLPTDQTVGMVDAFTAKIGARLAEVDQIVNLTHSSGSISVSLAAEKPLVTSQPGTSFRAAECIEVSPSLKEMGLDKLDVGVVSQGTKHFREAHPDRKSKIADLPELRLTFKATLVTHQPSQVLVLPLLHKPGTPRPQSPEKAEELYQRDVEVMLSSPTGRAH